MCIPNYKLAEEDYVAGAKYKDIADKYGVSISTVKSWKTRYHWYRESTRTKPEKVRIPKKVCKEVKQVCEAQGLTDKQRAFCLQYVRRFNATKAYQAAYGCNYGTARAEGSKALANPRIRDEILRLKQERLNREFLTEADIFQKYMDIAFADITDYVDFGRETVPVMGPFGPITVEDDDTGEKQKVVKEVNTVKFRGSADVDGTLITEVKQGRDGASLKLADRLKALEWLADHMSMSTEEQRARIDKLRAETARAKETEVDQDEVGVVMIPEVTQDG